MRADRLFGISCRDCGNTRHGFAEANDVEARSSQTFSVLAGAHRNATKGLDQFPTAPLAGECTGFPINMSVPMPFTERGVHPAPGTVRICGSVDGIMNFLFDVGQVPLCLGGLPKDRPASQPNQLEGRFWQQTADHSIGDRRSRFTTRFRTP